MIKEFEKEVIGLMFKTFTEDYRTYLRMKEFVESEKGRKFLRSVEILRLNYGKNDK